MLKAVFVGALALNWAENILNNRKADDVCWTSSGPDVDKVWKEENLVRLLPFQNGDIIVDYLRALRELYSVAVRKILPPAEVRRQVVDNYRATLRAVVVARIVTETPKCRILAVEVPRYWEITGQSLYFALKEQHESTHAQLKQSELAHGTRVKINRGTEKHIETLTRSVVYFTSKNNNLLPKIDEEDEVETQMTIQSVPEQEAPEEQVPSDPVPIAVYTAEDVASLQRQLAQAREELSVTAPEEELAREEITAEEQEPSDHAPVPVFTEEDAARGDVSVEEQEDLSNLQRQLAEARQEITARDIIIMVIRRNVLIFK